MVRYIFLIILTLYGFTSFAQTHFDVEQVHHISENELLLYKAREASNRARDVDVTYHACHWKIDPGFAYIVGKVTTEFIPLESNQHVIHFDLLKSMMVDSVTHKGEPVSFNHEDNVLAINFTQALSTKESVTIHYQGIPVTDGLSTFKADSFRGSPVIWTLSQPYGAPGWWPCNSALGERIDSIDVFLDIPEEFVGVSHGLLQDTSFYADRAIYHWKHKHSIPSYLVAFAAGDYTFFEDQVQLKEGVLPFHNYLYTQVADSIINQANITKELLQFYDSIFVPYPYIDEKYGHVQFTRNGGMEHTTISFMNNFNVELIGHELVHQWVGDLVTCASWQELWLNEGVTSYFTGLMYEFVLEGDLFPRWRRLVKEASLTRPNQTIYATDTTDVIALFDGTLRYTKPSYIMHMLRNQVGDSAFFSGFKNYLSDPNLAYGFATEDDLRKHMEASSGQDLSWFFEQWIHEPGHPIISANWEQFGNKIRVNWEQKSAAENGYVYKMPISFTAFYGDRQSTVGFEINEKTGEAILPVSGVVDSLLVDYDNQVLVEIDTIIQKFNSEPIAVFPNPSKYRVTIQVENSLGNIESIELSDSQGKTVYTATSVPTNYIELNVSNWPGGVYVGSVNTRSGATKEIKFVVQQ
jgi:aminopeptidase N